MELKKVVIDSDVIIDFLRTSQGSFLELLDLSRMRKIKLFVSSITAIELYSGNDLKQRKLVDEVLDKLNVVVVDRKLALMVGEARGKLGKSVGFADLIIGATCKFLGAELATRNKKHFEEIPGLKFWKGVKI
ncbi:type II toxin-antitoxin system VapC family toxin [Candidatus Amesbacteria bacterium]|nr:type II toxin-antitoxin system VapC family toxin [Candidatus Amesbacteria bacterium]